MKYECGGCNFKTENEAEYKKHKLELGKAFKKAVMKGLRDIPEPQQNRSSKAHVVHPSPKEAQIKEQYDNTEPSGKAEQDAIKEAPDWLQDAYKEASQKVFGAAPPISGWAELHTPTLTKAISQHIAEQVEAELEALNAKSYWANVRTDDMRARACIINAHHVVDRLRELRREA